MTENDTNTNNNLQRLPKKTKNNQNSGIQQRKRAFISDFFKSEIVFIYR